ncbi:alpha/beta fold hydrolase [Bacillus kexueae]|uniref:alpha/beta fold hydrolase n=1 Tax=Aeribacillus kexueae TaxID=2078952 RepID=UPI001FAFEFED|nr:alpha/beta hydrolase [Bacillus kexueae]
MLEYKVFEGPSSEYLVLIHGFGGNCSIFHKQIRFFQKYFNVVTIHLPGHGKSPSPDQYNQPFSFNLAARECIRILDHLRIEKAHFLTISLGSVIVHCLMNHYPERVKSAVLGGAITRLTWTSKTLVACGKVVKSFTPHIWLYKLFAHIIMPRKNHHHSREMFVKAAQKMKRKDFLAWFHLVNDVQSTFVINEKTKAIPKLYLSGREDHLFVNAIQKDVQSDDNAQMIVIEKCGHVCNVDKADEFNQHALSFLQYFIQEKSSVS